MDNAHERTRVCAITGLVDFFGSGLVDSCHIVDAALMTQADPGRYDPSNRLWLSKTLHQAWDSRLFTISTAGQVQSCVLSQEQLHTLGIPEDASLTASLLTAARRDYLTRRLDWREFMIAAGVKRHAEPKPTTHSASKAQAKQNTEEGAEQGHSARGNSTSLQKTATGRMPTKFDVIASRYKRART